LFFVGGGGGGGGEGLWFVLHSAKISSAPSILIFCVHPCEKLCEVSNY